MQEDADLTAVVRSRQLHIYRNGKKVLVLAGKAAPKPLPRGPLHRARETRKGLWEGVAETLGATGCGAQLRSHGVDMPRLEPAGLEGVPQYRRHTDGRVDGAAVGRDGVEALC